MTFSLASLICALLFLIVTFVASSAARKVPFQEVTKKHEGGKKDSVTITKMERDNDGLTALAVIAGLACSVFFVVGMFLWAGGL